MGTVWFLRFLARHCSIVAKLEPPCMTGRRFTPLGIPEHVTPALIPIAYHEEQKGLSREPAHQKSELPEGGTKEHRRKAFPIL